MVRYRWLQDQWNKPDRTDHYLMQIALSVLKAAAKKGTRFSLDEFKIPFDYVNSKPTVDYEDDEDDEVNEYHPEPVEPPRMTAQQTQTELSKAKWFTFTGFKKPKNS